MNLVLRRRGNPWAPVRTQRVVRLEQGLRSIAEVWACTRAAVERRARPAYEALTAQIRQRPGAALGVAFGAGLIAARLIRA